MQYAFSTDGSIRMLEKLFGFDSKHHSIRTEITAGVTTFLTMAYILAVNPSIFAPLAEKGMPTGAVFTATALAAVVGTLVMAIYAKKPFALAPGMGLNAFFVYTVCLTMGYTWQFALTAILVEGLLFIALTLGSVREMIANSIPMSLKKAIAAGIGLFIAFMGLENAGIVVHSDATLVTLGKLSAPSTLLAMAGFLLMSVLYIRRVRGALLYGILAVTIAGIPLGITHFDGLASLPPSIAPIALQFEFHHIFTWDMAIIVMTFLFMDLFDTIGTVVGVSMKIGMVDDQGNIPSLRQTLMSDAVATVAGACLGTNTTTTFVESAAGISEGGRTGLTAFTVAACFAIAVFFAPVFLAVPAVATAPALVLVGLFMMSAFTDVQFGRVTESIPAFVTLLAMPLTYSIANGILLGTITYVVLNALTGKTKAISPVMWALAAIFMAYYAFAA